MILNDRQKKIRLIFRETIIDNWVNNEKIYMFNTAIDVSKSFGITYDEAIEEMAAIPSIGRFWNRTSMNVWVAKYFKPIAESLWNGTSKKEVLKLWSKTKRTLDVTKSKSVTDKKHFAEIAKANRKLRALKEFYKSEPDRNGKTSWDKCK